MPTPAFLSPHLRSVVFAATGFCLAKCGLTYQKLLEALARHFQMDVIILEAAKFIHDEEHEHHKLRVSVDGTVKDVWLLNRNGHNDAFYTKILAALGLNSYKVTPFDSEWFLASPAIGCDIRDLAAPISETGRLHLAYYAGVYTAVADVFSKLDGRAKDFRIDAQALEAGRDGVTPIDHESLFCPRDLILDNAYLYTRMNRAPENQQGIQHPLSLLVFRNPDFMDPAKRAKLLERFEQGYMEGFKKAQASLADIRTILGEFCHAAAAQRIGKEIASFLGTDPLARIDDTYVYFLGAFFGYIWNTYFDGVQFNQEQKTAVLSREVTWRSPAVSQ